MYEYCSRLFDFKKIQVKRFKTWKSRHEFRKQKLNNKAAQSLVCNSSTFSLIVQIFTNVCKL